MCGCKRHGSLGGPCTCQCSSHAHLRPVPESQVKREWKPGDVAMVNDPAHGDLQMMFFDDRTECWHGVTPDGSMRCLDADQANDARPLLVIDAEDSDQVRGLLWAWGEQYTSWTPETDGVSLGHMQAALRSLLPTPKPPEPTSKWSVVEDREGVQWLRTEDYRDGDETVWLKDGWFSTSEWTHYMDIAAVKIIRDGVA